MLRYFVKCSFITKLLIISFFLVLYNAILVGTSYYTMLFCAIALISVPMKKYFDEQARWLIAFSLLYSIMHFFLGIRSTHIPLYLLAPILFYCFGNFIVDALNSKVSLLEFITLTIFVFSLVTFYTCIIDVRNVGLINPSRIMGRMGGGEYDMAATLYGMNVSLGMTGLFIFLSIEKNSRSWVHYLLPLSFALSLLTTIHLVNRTGLVLAFFSFLTFLMYHKINSKRTLLLLLLFLIVFGYLSTKSDFLQISDAYGSRVQTEGHDLTDAGNRTDKWLDALSRLFTFPFGWYKDVKYTFTHNMWLDVARLTGIVPFVAMVVVTLKAIKKNVALYAIKNDSLVLGLLSIFVVFYLESFMEPVMEGFDLYFYLLCMFWGIQKRYLDNFKQISDEKIP